MAIMTSIVDLEVIREGPVHFFSKGFGKPWKQRYLVVTRAGVCDIYMDETKQKRHTKKKGGGFHLQGGETVEPFDPNDKNVNFGFQVIESKKTWQFATDTEKMRDDWISSFKNVLKQLNALIHLQKVMNKPNHNTLEGKLEFADALAKCGQLAKARRIFSKLIVDFNDNKAHRGYEEFLVKSCHDVYQAESHFLRRIKFFVVPKTFLPSAEGKQFSMISHRISFFDSSKKKDDSSDYKDEQKQRQLESILPDAVKSAKARNLEDDWPHYLYKVDNGYMDEAKALIKNWIKRVSYNQRKFEYSYEEIESNVWDVMYDCSNGKKGTTRLEFRLKAVMQDKKNKIQDSKDALAPVDQKDAFLTKSKSESEKKSSHDGNNSEHVKKMDTLTDRTKFFNRGISQSVLSTGEMEDLDGLVGDILEDYEFSDHENSHSASHKNKNDNGTTSNGTNNNNNKNNNGNGGNGLNRTLSDPMDSDDEEEKEMIREQNRANNFKIGANRMQTVDLILDSIDPPIDDSGAIAGTSLLNAMSSGVGSDNEMMPKSNRGYNSDDAFSFNGGKRESKSATRSGYHDTTHFFETVSTILDNKDNHIFPWTAFMLVWMMRRDNMSHIGGSSANENQIRAILEFVYLFARGCFSALQDHWEYTLLLTSLYHNAVDGADPEDVKQKLCLQAVTVIGDENVPFSNKKAVFDFLRENLWLQYNQENVHKATTRNFFLKGIRVELKRIQDELNQFYESAVYSSDIYAQVVPINDKTKVSAIITRQDHDKVQGKCTWGPRKENRYDRGQFKDICANRNIVPPKPSKNEGNFDEAYLLFCLELAKNLDPHFQKRVRNSIINEIPSAVHYPAPPKTFDRAYHKITHDMQHLQSPRASRLCDYCRCVIGFQTLADLRKGFTILEKAFRLCKIVNTFSNKKQINVENYQYIDVYVLAQHPQNQFNKLVCEVRLTLQKVRDLDFERRVIRDCFENNKVLSAKEITSIMKEIARDARKQDKLNAMKRSSQSGSKELSKSKSKSKR